MASPHALEGNRTNRDSRRGATMVEFALTFLPFLILLVGVSEVGRAMWTYHTLAGAAKQGTRFAIVKGARCAELSVDCPSALSEVTEKIRLSGLGLDPDQIELTLSVAGHSVSCTPLSSCLNNSSIWPASPNNAIGSRVTIQAIYPFQPILGAFWPGEQRATYRLTASSSETIQF